MPSVTVEIRLPDGRALKGEGNSELAVRMAILRELGLEEVPVGATVTSLREA